MEEVVVDARITEPSEPEDSVVVVEETTDYNAAYTSMLLQGNWY